MEIDVKNLHPLEVKVIRSFKPGAELTTSVLADTLGYNVGQANQAFSWLSAKYLVSELRRSVSAFFEITDLGKQYAAEGTPEFRIVDLVQKESGLTLPDVCSRLGIENKDAGSAFGQLSRDGILAMTPEKTLVPVAGGSRARLEQTAAVLVKAASAGILSAAELSPGDLEIVSGMAKKRGAATSPFKMAEREEIVYTLASEAAEVKKILESAGITGEEISALTPEMLANGSWKTRGFRSFSVNVPPARLVPGRRNPYSEYLEWVKNKLVSLGFAEFDGPLVETEFWNSDALFMPQFHSARDIHDVYYLKQPQYAREIEQPYLDQVAGAHENGWKTGSRGWNYKFDRDFTRRLILRSQGTVMSAKSLTSASVPGKHFGILRCFRYDKVDATHLSDFYQTEGIVLGEDVNLRTLLGLLKMFAEEVAMAKEVKYVPGYFPFTEPSVEVHIKHPVLGWFELGGAGIFRPEVTEPLGIKVPVLAWGLGIDRMALMSLGLKDLRELFAYDIENVRLRRRT